MSGAFWSGVLAAWAVVQFIFGVFFLLTYYKGRREGEYFIFGIMCFVLAAHNAANMLRFGVFLHSAPLTTLRLSHGTGIIAVALHLHFALYFAQAQKGRFYLIVPYLLALVYEILIWTPLWWESPAYSTVVTRLWGDEVSLIMARASLLGKSFYLLALVDLSLATWFFIQAYRRGRREALSLLLGIAVVMPAGIHDLLMVLDSVNWGVNLLPHAFVLYGFGTAGTLLVRHRAATLELEKATLELHERNEELRHSHAELNRAQRELVTKRQLATVGELAAAIAHEVRNPLAVIVNAVSGLRRGAVKANDRGMLLDIVDEEAGRLNQLVTDLLRFARPVTINRAELLLSELASRLRVKEGYQIQVEVHEEPQIRTVWFDAGLFRLVFDNLVENACQAMKEGGTVKISFAAARLAGEHAVRIEVRDHGRGMLPEVQARALDPFYTTRPSGTGLGLPIVSRIVEAHGGKLTIESEDGVGTAVSILVPVGGALETLRIFSQDTTR